MKLAWYAAGTGGLAVVLAWWLAQTTGEVTAPVAQRPAQASPSFLPVASALTAGPARPAQEPGWAAPTANPVRHAVVPITLAAPQRLQVGEQTELVVGVGGNAEVDDIRLTLRFDPNVLQVRAGAPANGPLATAMATALLPRSPKPQTRCRSAARWPAASSARQAAPWPWCSSRPLRRAPRR